MKITKIKLVNYRSFKETEINLENLHCLVGQNASGKSNVLYALDLVLGERSYYGRIEETDFHCWASNISDSLVIQITFDEIFYKEFTFSFPVADGDTKSLEIKVPIPFDGVCLEAKRREKKSEALDFPVIFNRYIVPAVGKGNFYEKNNTYYFNNVNGTTTTVGLQELSSSDGTSWVVTAMDKTNSGWPVKDDGSKKWGRLLLRKDMLYLDSQTAEKLPTFLYLDENRITPEASKSRYSIINRILQDFQWNYRKQLESEEKQNEVSEAYEVLKRTISTKTSGLVELEKSLNNFFSRMLNQKSIVGLEYIDKYCPFLSSYFSKTTNNKDIPIASSGTGFNCLLTLAVISHFQKALKGTGRYVTIGIDEPELYLHPQGRGEYLSFLKEISAMESSEHPIQVVITTHSPDLVPIDKPESISRLALEEGKTKVYPEPEKLEEIIQGKTIKQHLDDIPRYRNHERIYLKENNELFFASKVIIVEGPLEKYTLRFLCELNKDYQFPSQWPTIICAHGKGNIKHYQLICRAFSIPYFTLFDEDGGDSEKEGENADIEASVLDDLYAKIPLSFEKQFSIENKNYTGCYEAITSYTSWESLPEGVSNALSKMMAFSNS